MMTGTSGRASKRVRPSGKIPVVKNKSNIPVSIADPKRFSDTAILPENLRK